jgi:hypothetical protein
MTELQINGKETALAPVKKARRKRADAGKPRARKPVMDMPAIVIEAAPALSSSFSAFEATQVPPEKPKQLSAGGHALEGAWHLIEAARIVVTDLWLMAWRSWADVR